MSNLREEILKSTQSLPEGGLVSPKEFLHMASRAAVDQALARLTREGKLLRVGRGLYSAPISGKFGNRPPSTEAVLEAIQTLSGETVVCSGATEANTLGLTTQVPTTEIFLTSGPSRKMQLGKRKIELRHCQRWQLAMGNRPAGKVIRALFWVGPEHATEALQKLRGAIPVSEWTAIRSARAQLPSWMAKAVSEAQYV